MYYNVAPGTVASPEATQRSLAAWTELLMLAKCVLAPPPRTGKKHRHYAENYTRCRLERWQDGERTSLWAHPRQRRPSANQTASRKHALAKAVSLVEEGKYGQGGKALTSPPLVAHDSASEATLRSKHPRGANVDPESARGLPPANPVDSAATLKALKAFPKGAGPGPTGLRPQHLLDGCAGPEQAAALQALSDVVVLLSDARAPAELVPYLAGAALMALPKDDNDLRPVAVGESLRRLTSKCLCATVKDFVRDLLTPLQVGVSCPLGAESAVHVVRDST